MQTEDKDPPSSSFWSIDLLRKYFNWVKTKLKPVLTSEAESILLEYYQQVRRNEDRQSSRMTIRMLESIVRISQVYFS